MKKLVFVPLIVAVAGLLLCTACTKKELEEDSKKGEVINKEDPEPNIATILLGSWQEKDTNVHWDGVWDTLTFSNDGIVFDKTGVFNKYKYRLLDDTTLLFMCNECRCSPYTYPITAIYFTIEKDSTNYEIKFYNYITSVSTHEIKKITYTKLH